MAELALQSDVLDLTRFPLGADQESAAREQRELRCERLVGWQRRKYANDAVIALKERFIDRSHEKSVRLEHPVAVVGQPVRMQLIADLHIFHIAERSIPKSKSSGVNRLLRPDRKSVLLE
jgi:hypothetical protein